MPPKQTISARNKEILPRLPDLRRRSVKIRLLMLVFSVMLVLVLMFESRKPENWEWMGFTKWEPEVDTRYLNNLYDEDKKQTQEPLDLDLEKESDRNLMLEVAEKKYWDKVYSNLNYRQRMLLLEGLYLARQNKILTAEKSSEWLRIAEAFELDSSTYQADILKYLTGLPESDPQRAGLNQLLFQFKKRWEKHKPILEAIGTANSIGELKVDRADLNQLQASIDRTVISFIQDNSLQSFVDDQPAMFRLFERIMEKQSAANESDSKKGSASTSSPQTDSTDDPESVMYLHLYKETDRLRAKEVTFKGTIRTAYLSSPTENYLGIDDFYVFWVQIKGAHDLVAVYSLSKPENFIVPIERHNQDQDEQELNEPVEVNGVLFQKMVYRSIDGTRIAPAVLTDQIIWAPKPSIPKPEELPGLTGLVVALLAIGGVAILGTWAVSSLSNRRHEVRLREMKQRFEGDETKSSPDESAPSEKEGT